MATISSIAARQILPRIAKLNSSLAISAKSLSSGLKQSPGVADFAIGKVLQGKATALTTALSNAGQAKSLLNTAKGGLDEILDLLQEQKSLATKAADSSLSSADRAALDAEFQTLVTEINRLAANTSFNGKNLLDGSIGGTNNLTSATGQSTENYTLLTTADFSTTGTVAAGNLVTTSTFSFVNADAVGDGYASTTITLTHVDETTALTTDAVFSIGGATVTFGSGNTTSAQLGTSLVAALEASTNANIRQFTFLDNGDGTITVTGADAGDAVNGVNFQLSGNGGGGISAATLGTATDIDGVNATISSAAGSTEGTDRSVAVGDRTFDATLLGGLSNFASTLSTSGTQNTVTFTVEINNTTFTSQAVTLFGTGGFNSKGNTIKTGQVITFYDTAGPTDSSGDLTDNAFTLTIGGSDVTVAGADQTAFESSLDTIAQGFGTQLTAVKINQTRDVILSEVNANGGDFDISVAVGTDLAGIEGFDAIGANAEGDIQIVSDQFADNGTIGDIGSFSFSTLTSTLTTTLNGETFTADLTDSADFTGTFDSGSGTLTTDGIIILHSAATDDGRQIRIDLSNVTADDISIGTTALATTFTNSLDAIFDVDDKDTLNFQVGTEVSDVINIDINSATTSEIYLNDAGTAKTLSITTVANAQTASEVLDNAINTINSAIAGVSADITAFDASISATTTTLTNTEDAAAALLETDFSEESTNFAELTVRLEAAYLSLAQLNNNLGLVNKLLGG